MLFDTLSFSFVSSARVLTCPPFCFFLSFALALTLTHMSDSTDEKKKRKTSAAVVKDAVSAATQALKEAEAAKKEAAKTAKTAEKLEAKAGKAIEKAAAVTAKADKAKEKAEGRKEGESSPSKRKKHPKETDPVASLVLPTAAAAAGNGSVPTVLIKVHGITGTGFLIGRKVMPLTDFDALPDEK